MNGVINTNYIPANSFQYNFNPNNQGLKMNKDTFLNMMTMLINDNQDRQSSNHLAESGLELDFMDIITGNGLVNLNEINSMTFDANEEASGTFDTKKEDKIYSQTVLNNFMIMMNYNFNNEKINIEKLPTEESEMQVGILPMNVEEPNNLQMPQSKTNDTFDFSKVVTKDSMLKSNYNVEKLVAEIEGNSEKQKNEIDFNAELQMPKENLINRDNKIITLSDESSRIKSQVLSQLKDKIVFHTEKAPTSKNEIKHVTMELQPHNLGKVDVKITFQDNKITVEIKALNEETQKILSSNAGELANILNKSTESSINIVVKNFELQHERQQLSYNQNQEQSYNEGYDQNDGHGRQRGFYYKENKNKDSDEDSTFTELINLRNLKSI